MDKDIQDLFKKKNKEILITNLKFDLDKNIDSLLETITNIFNLEFDTAIKKIVAVLNDSSSFNDEKKITEIVNLMKMNNYTSIEEFIKDKKELLLDNISLLEFTQEGMDKYYDVVLISTKDFKEELKESLEKEIESDKKKLEEYINSKISEDKKELTLSRISEYLENRLYGKLETKIHMEIMLRDNNLINKAKEVYLRYQDICSKTE